ncbi:MAG TPA: glycosyltransferase family 39 protein [Longimicrobiales bacterium]
MTGLERWRSALVRRPVLWLALLAILLRVLMLFGRGSYVAFDEGWYLLLGRNLWSGAGYTLSGLDHVTLSPLFPILAGGLSVLTGDAIWAGRLVAAICAGLVVVPAWYLFRRLADERIATHAAAFVAVMPALCAFTVPFWIRWELWVGAEPVLHLFLYSALALALRAFDRPTASAAIACGAAFALAYLARPEAIVVFALAGTAFALASARSRNLVRPRLIAAALCVVAFAVVAAPYWLYLHEQLDRWTVTGRGVELAAAAGGSAPSGAATTIESMLWEDEEGYVRRLYALDRSGTALASDYWGVRQAAPDSTPTQMEAAGARTDSTDPSEQVRPAAAPASASEGDPGSRAGAGVGRYIRSLLTILPWWAWLFAIAGAALPRGRRRRAELLVAAPLIGTSVLIAVIVATDPRTQLFLAPWLAFYMARGVVAAGRWIQSRVGPELREGVAVGLVSVTLAFLMVGVSARRLYLSVAVGSPHHIVGAENAAVGAALRSLAPAGAPVMSWHPALALYAGRDWRVLPFEPLSRIVRFARTQSDPVLVLSVYYPPPILQGDEAPHYLIVPVPRSVPDADRYRIRIDARLPAYATGTVIPSP